MPLWHGKFCLNHCPWRLLTLIPSELSLLSLVSSDGLILICGDPTWLDWGCFPTERICTYVSMVCYQVGTTSGHTSFWLGFMICSFLRGGTREYSLGISPTSSELSNVLISILKFRIYSCFPRLSEIFHHFAKRETFLTFFLISFWRSQKYLYSMECIVTHNFFPFKKIP